MSGISRIPEPRNELAKGYTAGSPERAEVVRVLDDLAGKVADVPLYIGHERVFTGQTADVTMPHAHRHVLATAHQGGAAEVEKAIAAAEAARPAWAAMDFDARAAILLKAADMLTGPWRATMNAATMLGQSKTVHQAEIEAACELADFWRFNVAFARQIMEDQPISPDGQWNRVQYRPLDGFVFAVSPFNFTAIAGNLPTAPALMGNTVVWKPAPTQMLSAHYLMELLLQAGLPPGVVNLVQGPPQEIGAAALASPMLAGLHFTGSTGTFQHLWREIGTNIHSYRQYPRIVGETGGKDFIFAHPSADVTALACAIVRGGYEYQGQKCSAASRIYVPRSLWPKLKDDVVAQIESIKMGDVRNFENFMGAVIDERAFEKITGYVKLAHASGDCEVLAGGTFERAVGWFVRPTLVETTDPKHRLMAEEIFGPVVTLYVYDDAREEDALTLCDTTAPYALTGAVFAQDRYAVERIAHRLQGTAGNFYINDKPTGAVVGQQPFGGARGSGTNDKAGSMANLLRWTSARAIKETFVPPTQYRYPYQG
ncbi:MAG: L-glutamate gamma-semialdehyde dehydrogenase [Myxococcales bacterium]|nr:L-glutamate gamma-semialdehyde dehydrogenase [Myxococcales bacterium]